MRPKFAPNSPRESTHVLERRGCLAPRVLFPMAKTTLPMSRHERGPNRSEKKPSGRRCLGDRSQFVPHRLLRVQRQRVVLRSRAKLRPSPHLCKQVLQQTREVVSAHLRPCMSTSRVQSSRALRAFSSPHRFAQHGSSWNATTMVYSTGCDVELSDKPWCTTGSSNSGW